MHTLTGNDAATLILNVRQQLVAFYVSTGARASELLSATVAGLDPGTAADHGRA